MPAEPAVPVARLKKLWRRFRRLAAGRRRVARRKSDEDALFGWAEQSGKAEGFEDAADDLRAIIDEAKKGETR